MAYALRSVPKGSKVVAHSDLMQIKNIVRNRKPYAKDMEHVLKYVWKYSSGLDCIYKYEEKRKRSRFYKRCHIKAKQLAKSYDKKQNS